MSPMISPVKQTPINWDFQVEQQNHITRYGSGGGFYYKQAVLGSKEPIFPFPIKRISKQIYEFAQRTSKSLE